MKTKISLIAAMALVAGSAVAADSGFYAGAGIGYGKINVNANKIDNSIQNSFDSIGAPIDVVKSSVSQGSSPYSLTVGYKWMKYFATEISYIDLGNANYRSTIESGLLVEPPFTGTVKGQWDAKGWPVSVLGIWPIDDSWSVFGRVGLFMGDVKLTAKAVDATTGELICGPGGDCARGHTKDNSTQFIGGVGTDFNFMDTWTARLEWQAMPSLGNNDTGSGNWNNIQFSILYNF
jgi:opacity protein-like surface antigen